MKYVNVRSNTIDQIAFEEGTQMALGARPINIMRIVFTSGNIFDYYGVDKLVYNEFVKAESIGKFFHANIKNIYQYEKVNK